MNKHSTVILAAGIAHAAWASFSASGGNPVLDLIAYHDPSFRTLICIWLRFARRRRATRWITRPVGLEGLVPATGRSHRLEHAHPVAGVPERPLPIDRHRQAPPPDRRPRERPALLASHSLAGAIPESSSSGPSAREDENEKPGCWLIIASKAGSS